MTKQFTKADLEDGFKVVYRSGGIRFVMKRTNTLHEPHQANRTNSLCNYNHDLTSVNNYEDEDIMRVYDREDNLVWERVEKTPDQIEIEDIEQKMRELADRLDKLKK